MSDALAGRLVVVTGATGTVGRAVTAAVRAEGGRVLAQYRADEAGAATLRDVGALTVRADLTTDEGHRLLADALAVAGGADALVNTLHTTRATARVADMAGEVLQEHLDSVLLHARLLQLVLPDMRERGDGRIVYISGALAARPADGKGAYGAAKAAADALTRYVAWEEGPAGITANIVAPGRIVDPAVPEPELTPEWARLAEELRARLALRRFPTPQEVAHAVLSCLTPSASAITGQTIWVTGGESLR